MNEKKQMTVSDALRIAAWIFTVGALFLAFLLKVIDLSLQLDLC